MCQSVRKSLGCARITWNFVVIPCLGLALSYTGAFQQPQLMIAQRFLLYLANKHHDVQIIWICGMLIHTHTHRISLARIRSCSLGIKRYDKETNKLSSAQSTSRGDKRIGRQTFQFLLACLVVNRLESYLCSVFENKLMISPKVDLIQQNLAWFFCGQNYEELP